MSILRIVASFMRDYRPATPALPLQATPALSTHLRSPKSGGKGPSIKYRPHHRDPVIGYAVPLRHQGGGGRRRGQEIEQHLGAVQRFAGYTCNPGPTRAQTRRSWWVKGRTPMHVCAGGAA